MRFSPQAEAAGAQEPFRDAALYDWEYRRRRADVTFYRNLATERLAYGPPSPVLDLACGTGRLLVPLVRDGHTVIGLDRSADMLARAAARVRRLAGVHRRRALLVRGDVRAFAVRTPLSLAICAFHSVQHLIDDGDWLAFLRAARAALRPDGWLLFDIMPPDDSWIALIADIPERRWARTAFRHPLTRERLVYTVSYRYDESRKALHMGLHYQPIDEQGRPSGPERTHRLCHRQLSVQDVTGLAAQVGLRVIATYGGFDGRPLGDDAEEHIFVLRPAPR